MLIVNSWGTFVPSVATIPMAMAAFVAVSFTIKYLESSYRKLVNNQDTKWELIIVGFDLKNYQIQSSAVYSLGKGS